MEKPLKTPNPETKIIKIVDQMIKDNNWVISLNSEHGNYLRKSFNKISDEITTLLDKRKKENDEARKKQGLVKDWDDVLKAVDEKYQEWLEIKSKYNEDGTLKPLH